MSGFVCSSQFIYCRIIIVFVLYYRPCYQDVELQPDGLSRAKYVQYIWERLVGTHARFSSHK